MLMMLIFSTFVLRTGLFVDDFVRVAHAAKGGGCCGTRDSMATIGIRGSTIGIMDGIEAGLHLWAPVRTYNFFIP